MRNVLIVDTETTGLDPASDVAIEVWAILFSVEHATALESFSALIYHDENPAESINRIPPAALSDARDPVSAWGVVQDLATRADAFVAHNAEFDRRFAPEWLRDLKPWICTKEDIEWPKQDRPGMSLVPLALAHDLGVAVAHRALADCDLIARLLTRCRELGHDIDAMLTRGLRPKVTLMACVSFDDRELAKVAGFQQWLRRMVEADAAFDFPVRVVAEEE
jgi:DNA polymerase-3 subunit epsilon